MNDLVRQAIDAALDKAVGIKPGHRPSSHASLEVRHCLDCHQPWPCVVAQAQRDGRDRERGICLDCRLPKKDHIPGAGCL